MSRIDLDIRSRRGCVSSPTGIPYIPSPSLVSHGLMAGDSIIQFYVDDTSPTISYSPFGDTFSLPNLTAGWNPYFDTSSFASTIGEIGSGTSYHVTSCDGASLSVQWKGTSGT